MSIVTYENVDTPVFEIDFLRYLFADGAQGLLLSYLPDHLYADVDKTVPAAIGGGIASFDDLSGNGVTGPQPVSTARPIFRASPARGEYDLADDVLPRNAVLPAITDGTVILISKDGIWIDEGYSFAGGNWSLGPTTYPNGPFRTIRVVGDMLGLVVLDRPLTADERDKVAAYGVKRGSVGLIGLGPELLANPGGPFTDTAGWQTSTGMTGATISVSDGNLVLTSTGPGAANALTEFGFEQGKTYLVEFGIVSSNLIGQVRANGFANLNPTSITGGIIGSGQAQVGRNWAFYIPGSGLNAFGIGGRSDVTSLVLSYASIREVFPLTELMTESGDILLTEGGDSFLAEGVV